MSCRGMRWRGKRAEEVRGEEEEGDRGAGKGERLWRNRESEESSHGSWLRVGGSLN